MSQVWFFMTPVDIFSMLAETRRRHEFLTVLRRYAPRPNDPPPKFEVVQPDQEAARIYIDGGFSEIYITRNALPREPEDWHFVERFAGQLLTIEGGRLHGEVLEEAMLRVWTRPSDMQDVYRAIQRYLRKTCRRGMAVAGHEYRNRYYSPKVLNLRLVTGFAPGSSECRPLPSEEESRPN